MNSQGKIYALLATARIANVPSLFSNLAAGIFLTSSSENTWPWRLCLAAILFYVSGNFLNDWWDREWDGQHRPERALPRKRFPAHSYLITAALGFSLGLFLVSVYPFSVLITCLILCGFILLYTLIHKRTALSVIPMGICRACLPLLGYLSVGNSLTLEILFPCFALLFYIIALSISARWESNPSLSGNKTLFPAALLFGAGLIACSPMIFQFPALGWIGLLPFTLWIFLALTRYRSPISAHVSALLAGIPLIDWIALLPLAFILLGEGNRSLSHPLFLGVLLISPLSFLLGRVLQRLAPAT